MNIFFTDRNPVLAAQSQPDKMLVKMVLETAQMLCNAHRVCDPDETWHDEVGLYKIAFKNHPCSVWARQSVGNYHWLCLHFHALCDEYRLRYQRVHACDKKFRKHFNNVLYVAPKNIAQYSRTPVAQAMPDEYKNDDPVKAYRDYVINEKHYAEWNHNRNRPDWWQ